MDDLELRGPKSSSLERLFTKWSSRPPLYPDALTPIVPGNGDILSRVMLIGEAPGAQEDKEGKPFIGSAGQLLDQALSQQGVPRQSVYVTNMVKCRPPGNRVPTSGEIETHRQILEAEVGIINPKAILLLGSTALLGVTGKKGITAARGLRQVVKKSPWEDRYILATWHPAYLRRAKHLQTTWILDIQDFFERAESLFLVSV